MPYRKAETIHLVMDNLNIHCSPFDDGSLWRADGVATFGIASDDSLPPKHGSWLNQEIEIGLFSRQCLGRRRIPDLTTLRRESPGWNRHMNREGIKVNCKFDRRAARRKFGYKRKSFKRA